MFARDCSASIRYSVFSSLMSSVFRRTGESSYKIRDQPRSRTCAASFAWEAKSAAFICAPLISPPLAQLLESTWAYRKPAHPQWR